MDKRGMSTVVVVMLFVLLTIVVIIGLWEVVKATLVNSADEAGDKATSVSFDISGESIKIDEATKHLKFNLNRNSGPGTVVSVKVVLYDSKDKNYISDWPGMNELESNEIEFYYAGTGLKDVKKISIAPVIKDSNGNTREGPIALSKEIKDAKTYSFNSKDLGLVAYLDMETLSSGKLGDLSGRGNGGQFFGTSDVVGKIGRARGFNGVGDYIEVANSPTLALGSFSYTAWVKRDVSAGWDPVLSKGAVEDTSNGFGFLIDGLSNNPFSYFDTQLVSSANIINFGEWKFIAVTINQSNPTNGNCLYLNDSSPVCGALAAQTVGTNDITIGASLTSEGAWSDQYLNGIVDEVRIYNRVLLPSEIKGLYEQGF